MFIHHFQISLEIFFISGPTKVILGRLTCGYCQRHLLVLVAECRETSQCWHLNLANNQQVSLYCHCTPDVSRPACSEHNSKYTPSGREYNRGEEGRPTSIGKMLVSTDHRWIKILLHFNVCTIGEGRAMVNNHNGNITKLRLVYLT